MLRQPLLVNTLFSQSTNDTLLYIPAVLLILSDQTQMQMFGKSWRRNVYNELNDHQFHQERWS